MTIARPFSGVLTRFIGGANSDEVLIERVRKLHFSAGTEVIVSHDTRENATVPKGDLVNKQLQLSDGRLFRVQHASPEHKGDNPKAFIRAEAPRTPAGPQAGPQAKPLTPKAAIAFHFGLDAREMEDRRYQPMRTPVPVYTVHEDYFTATRGARPPKAHPDWNWVAVPSKATELYGNTIWTHKDSDE